MPPRCYLDTPEPTTSTPGNFRRSSSPTECDDLRPRNPPRTAEPSRNTEDQQPLHLLRAASAELEAMRAPPPEMSTAAHGQLRQGRGRTLSPLALCSRHFTPFPPACRMLLHSIEGNRKCVDCGDPGPQWATVTYGALLCVACAGWHRSLGVSKSSVRSVSMDSWSAGEVMSMLEGGNGQLAGFFGRHDLPPGGGGRFASGEGGSSGRYRTRAAKFYGDNLAGHVERVSSMGEYRGRELSRRGHSRRGQRCRPST